MEVEHDVSSEALLRAAERVPSCALDSGARAAQARRYRRLACSVRGASRQGHALVVELSEDFDRENLEQLIAVERQCCPFLAIGFDQRARRLEMRASSPEGSAALEVVAEGLAAGRPTPGP